MNLIFKNATVIDKNSPFHKQAVDIKVENGVIAKIAKDIASEANFEIVELPNLHVSRGWFDKAGPMECAAAGRRGRSGNHGS